MGFIIKLRPDRILCESMNGIRSVTSEITFWKEEEGEENTEVKYNGFSSANVEDIHNKGRVTWRSDKACKQYPSFRFIPSFD